jgi:hypothetical protein
MKKRKKEIQTKIQHVWLMAINRQNKGRRRQIIDLELMKNLKENLCVSFVLSNFSKPSLPLNDNVLGSR